MSNDKNINAKNDPEEFVYFDDSEEIKEYFREKNLLVAYHITKSDLWQRLGNCKVDFSKEKLFEVFPELHKQEDSEEILTFTRGELLKRFLIIKLMDQAIKLLTK